MIANQIFQSISRPAHCLTLSFTSVRVLEKCPTHILHSVSDVKCVNSVSNRSKDII